MTHGDAPGGLWVMSTVLLAASILRCTPAAARLAGEGRGDTDCWVELAGSDALDCTDCDPTCDADGVGTADGECTFAVSLCLNQVEAGCTPTALARVKVSPADALRIPALSSTTCGATPDRVVVPTRRGGRKPGRRKITVSALASGRPRRVDRDVFVFRCRPRVGACPTTTTSTSSTTTTSTVPQACDDSACACGATAPTAFELETAAGAGVLRNRYQRDGRARARPRVRPPVSRRRPRRRDGGVAPRRESVRESRVLRR